MVFMVSGENKRGGMMSNNVRAIEVGYGSLSFTEDVVDDLPVIKTFASVVSPVSSEDLTGGLSRRDTVLVNVGSNVYEVGPDAYLLSDRSSSRVLNNTYIETEQYQALFKAALLMMKGNEVIDLLVLSLPVNNMSRANDLKQFALGEHVINEKTVVVKNVWVLSQPLAGYLWYANVIGQDAYNELKEQSVLSLDFGFSTADWLVGRGLKINEKKSGAADMGMSLVLEESMAVLKKAFVNLDTIPMHVVDEAFWKHPGYINISGRRYPFPRCVDGKDYDGNDTKIKFDATGAINKVAASCLQTIRNNVGAGAEIGLILVMGGSHKVYLDEIKKTYPEHRIEIVSEPMTAVCRGMYFGGLQYLAALQKKNAA